MGKLEDELLLKDPLFSDFISRFKDVPIEEPKPPRKECCGRPLKVKEDAEPTNPNIPLSKLLGRLDPKFKLLMVIGSISALLQGEFFSLL